jgi:hypothetical protein
LIEAGVRLVHVGWPRDPGDTAVDNPLWDTHAQNADRLEDVLCPMFDVGYSALIEDLDQRGLLDETLVVAIAEFGRTPKINKYGGRDHWGHVFSFALAGAGIRGGQVYGSSDKTGGYPAADRVEPQQLTATVFHLLGIGHDATFPDRLGRPLPVSKGEPLATLIGTSPATTARTQPGGDISLVPPYDDRQMRDTDFEDGRPLVPHDAERRTKTWQASPILIAPGSAGRPPLGVTLVNDPSNSRGGSWHATLGVHAGGASAISAGARAMLSQEVRNPRAGRFTFTVHACGGGTSGEFYRDVFQKNFACRLVIFGFHDLKKDHRQQRVFATADIQPSWSADGKPRYDKFQVAATLRSQDGGAMETSYGIGAAIVVEKITPGDLVIAADGTRSVPATLSATGVSPVPSLAAFIRIDDVAIDFNPRPRDDNVTV